MAGLCFPEEEQDAIDGTDVLTSPATASQQKKRRKHQQPELSALERSQKRQRVYRPMPPWNSMCILPCSSRSPSLRRQ
ncbi:hypothetical protein BS47DRAFT_762059 [Hydnum rufescens UP504]|uniref:Uncharacterized protein n=1 Tax=Hydnum rufescens UP504 TaxID=1448309 RepID=A0A9P6BBG5_9AGAM|nr:hypothetical protein BS47DRAFT_762059 [Hydnum rufescens UP504]